MVCLEEFVNSSNWRKLPFYIVLFKKKRKFVFMFVVSASLNSSWCCDHQNNLMPLHLSNSCKENKTFFMFVTF